MKNHQRSSDINHHIDNNNSNHPHQDPCLSSSKMSMFRSQQQATKASLIHLVAIATFLVYQHAELSLAVDPPPLLRGAAYGSSLLSPAAFADPDDTIAAKPLNPNRAVNDLAASKPHTTTAFNRVKVSNPRLVSGNNSAGGNSKLNGDHIKLAREGALYLNSQQRDLIKRNPGSLLAVARAFKMAISECQYQMRHEPWDCPVLGFSIRPQDIFGKLMSRNFKETSFIHSLLSSAIAHSITRACTESMITTCGRKQTRDGGYSEDIDFGRQFAQLFMEATHESLASSAAAVAAATSNSIDRNPNNNLIVPGSGTGSGDSALLHQYSSSTLDPLEREKRIRDNINAHNDEVGRLHILNGMRRDCKCHGLSGACTIQTCWLKLPPFREVATKLHESLDQAIKIIYQPKSLTPGSVKKSNKKRSSVQQVNGLSRSSASQVSSYSHTNEHPYSYLSSNSLTSDTANMIVSRPKGTKRHTNKDDCEDCNRAPVGGVGTATVERTAQEGSAESQQGRVGQLATSSSAIIKKRPVARSIGVVISHFIPSKTDLLYREDSPDFCSPSPAFNIKGTKGRVCSENPDASNNCSRLCCKRGYVTEVREEHYKCECQFKFCCSLICNTCTRKKTTHICL